MRSWVRALGWGRARPRDRRGRPLRGYPRCSSSERGLRNSPSCGGSDSPCMLNPPGDCRKVLRSLGWRDWTVYLAVGRSTAQTYRDNFPSRPVPSIGI
jgi:hypothetical protein